MELMDKNEPRSSATFQCTICPKSFVYKQSLEEHILNKHVDDKEFQCTQCYETNQLVKSFATQHILNKHIKRVHGPPRFKCHVCFKTFTETSNFASHKRIHSQTDLNRHTCNLCSKSYRFKHMLHAHLFNAHKQKCEGVTYFHCEMCSREFLNRSKLELHVIRQHVVDKAFECPVCSKTFIDQQTLEKHMKTHDRQNKYFCHVCSKGFTCKRGLINHHGVQHSLFFYCDKCFKSYKNKSDFDAHISDSLQELKCSICQEIINSECSLKIHTDSHVKEIKTKTTDVKIENAVELAEIFTPTKSTEEKNSEKLECDLCAKTFDREAYFKAHRNQVHPNAEWKCNFEKCFKIFKMYYQLKLHKMEHAETKQFACNICQKSFYRPKSLKDHEQVHLKEKKFKCETCPKSFTKSFALRIHIANNHGGVKPFKCPVFSCGTFWARNSQLNSHLISHQTERSFKCEICLPFRAFKTLKHLVYHQRQVHNADAKKIKALKSQKLLKNWKLSDAVVFMCSSNECSFETADEKDVALHYSEQHQLPKVLIVGNSSSLTLSPFVPRNFETIRMIQKRYTCRICREYFQYSSSFYQHQKRFHSDQAQVHVKEHKYKCEICPKSFPSPSKLRIHIGNNHGGNKPFKCPVVNCGTSWATNWQLNSHLVSHQIEKSFKRELCPEFNAFKSNDHLKSHQRVVHSHFQCTICQNSFLCKSSYEEHILNTHKEVQCTKCFENNQLVKSLATQKILNQHIKRVQDLPRFKCKVCFKTFRDVSSFRTHKRTHSHATIKEHKCAMCPAAYRFKQNLQMHLFNVHKQRREDVSYFKCELCSREFFYRSELERHVIDQHVVDKAFECPVCSNTFIDQQSLEKHMKTHNRQIEHFCHVCSKGFTLKKLLFSHLKVQHSLFFYCYKCCKSFENKLDFDEHISDSKQELKCYICTEIMNSECSLKIHVDSHVKDIKTERGDNKSQNPIKPLQINQLFTPRPRKQSHLEKLYVQLDLKCELCAETFERTSYFTAHRKLVHPNAEWKCNFQECSKIFKEFRNLRRHKMIHAATKDFTCNICGKSFHRPDSLKEHEQVHLKEKKFKCEACPKSFTISSALRIHIANNHGGVKPFKCPVVNCGTSWATNRQLKNHLISHETEKPYKCEICQKKVMAFKSLGQLKVHQRRAHSVKKKTKASKHSDAVVFICSSNTCSFETVSDAEVALHYNQQHQLPQVSIFGNNSSSSPISLVSEKKECPSEMRKMIDKRYKCQICSKQFKNIYVLTQHLQIHSRAKRVKCSACYRTFKLQRYLKQHIALYHCQNQKKR